MDSLPPVLMQVLALGRVPNIDESVGASYVISQAFYAQREAFAFGGTIAKHLCTVMSTLSCKLIPHVSFSEKNAVIAVSGSYAKRGAQFLHLSHFTLTL
eukprot:2928762-Pleurochrysis_carterae.AAC.7